MRVSFSKAISFHEKFVLKMALYRFFARADKQFEVQGLLPSSPFPKALAYARECHDGLLLYLDDLDVEIDMSSLERALHVIPMGKKNWMFCWAMLGARQIGIAQSLLVTCKLRDIDPCNYLGDVLQRVVQHPASCVHELTPRMWNRSSPTTRCTRLCIISSEIARASVN